MKECTPENLTIIANQIAIELSKGKSITELNVIKSVLSQITCVLQTIISQKLNQEINENEKK